MRTTFDRIRHAIGFEVIGLLLMVGILSQFGFELGHVGAVGVFFSIVATLWNYVYNQWFDNFMQQKYSTTQKTVRIRLLHSLGFEAGLLVFTIPVLAWVLNVSLWHAFVLDIGMVVFYLFYAYGYNLIYDRIYPISG
ncbi:transporter [Photobacterium kishitanii]|uniref:Transporter n=1 Tax=Photobacterium kishitanii TaxID=318456 RepID=A0AAX0Z2F0_9GAMM|nr:PACE efflux transporter [Photobacterium kishitanii]KJG11379.1 transporter [Photobacterium kishitanii]KJG56909.1 transporter [Photobacterium kishitanii]KJG62564.1 transporter [Photobacterium kishitanii]KJG66930.1 transporter [Photobacterium kishitanii]KJG70814.1 transporter [Photobacterium kishitanii]